MKKRQNRIATKRALSQFSSYSINHIFIFHNTYTLPLLAIVKGGL